MKKLAVVVLSLALMFFASGSFADEIILGNGTDQFTPYQEGKTPDDSVARKLVKNGVIPQIIGGILSGAVSYSNMESKNLMKETVSPQVKIQKPERPQFK